MRAKSSKHTGYGGPLYGMTYVHKSLHHYVYALPPSIHLPMAAATLAFSWKHALTSLCYGL
jgi:hypothetical protein